MSWWKLIPFLVTWNESFEAKPAGSRSPSYGDDDIRELKEGVRERTAKEHVHTIGSGAVAAHGWHRAGSARAYVQSGTGPTTKPDGTTSLGTTDKGRLWLDEGESHVAHVWDGSAWQGFLPEIVRVSIQGSLAVTGNAVPPVIFTRGVTVRKVSSRLGTAPSTQAMIFNIKRMYSNGLASVNLFKAGTMTISAGTYSAIRTIGQMTAAGYSLSADDYLKLSISQVGIDAPGADLGITVEVVVRGTR